MLTMTLLRIMSDLHLEFGPLQLDPIGEDVLILAGDIDVGVKSAIAAREYSDRTGIPVILIAGNHEYYHGNIPTVNHDIRYALANARVYFLNDSFVGIGGITILGSTLWTDYDLNGHRLLAMLSAARTMNDHRLIADFTPSTASFAHIASRTFLRTYLPRPPGTKTVVVTHHAPSPRSSNPKYADDPLMNACYASDLEPLVASSNAALWVHGHVHTSFDYTLGNTRVVCNPRGYYPRDLNPDFDPDLLIEV
jgi:predicted phosphohydrolase